MKNPMLAFLVAFLSLGFEVPDHVRTCMFHQYNGRVTSGYILAVRDTALVVQTQFNRSGQPNAAKDSTYIIPIRLLSHVTVLEPDGTYWLQGGLIGCGVGIAAGVLVTQVEVGDSFTGFPFFDALIWTSAATKYMAPILYGGTAFGVLFGMATPKILERVYQASSFPELRRVAFYPGEEPDDIRKIQ